MARVMPSQVVQTIDDLFPHAAKSVGDAMLDAQHSKMTNNKPKAGRAQLQPGGDDLDKWIDAACESDPMEFAEFIDEEAGPPLSTGEIRQARESLSKWQSPTDFRSATYVLCKRCKSKDWFKSPHLKFLHDAFVLAEFVGHQAVDQIRLAAPSDQWPDGYVRIANEEHNVEVTSEHGGRKLGDEYGSVTRPELVPSIATSVSEISRCLDSAIQAKVNKHYGSRAWLVIYLNMSDFFGIGQVETERSIKNIKQKHAGSFEVIYVLWKNNVI